MKTRIGLAIVILAVLVLGGLGPAASVHAQSGSRYGEWAYRSQVDVSCPCDAEVTDYQVHIELDSSNFNFDLAEDDGSDLRVTANDGDTPIPFWIESWDDTVDSESASVWVKVPVIPVLGTAIYLYYGNASPPAPQLVETPPTGPWTRAPGNPIVPADDPGSGADLLAENIVYDDATGHYWLDFAVYRGGSSVGLAWSDDPGNPAAWNWHGVVMPNANAPHLMEDEGTWYLFYADKANAASLMPGYSGDYPDSWPISVATSDVISGTYTHHSILLASTEPWEEARVDEPYVFQRNDDVWIMMYMGDAGGAVEQVSYATAPSITGPYTKYATTPALAFGPSGSFDAGTVADPWVVEVQGTYYIGYTVSPTTSSPWQTAMATTTDWLTFNKIGIIFPLGPSGEWDAVNSFRGAVTRIDNTYLFPYTGDGYMMGLATQPVSQTEVLNDPEEVFPFYDGFDGDALDTPKWSFASGNISDHTDVTDGILTLTATGTYVKIYGDTSVGMDYMVEALARDAVVTDGGICEIGLAGGSWDDTVRMADHFYNENWSRQTKTSRTTGDPFTDMGIVPDASWHTFGTYRLSPDVAGFQIDSLAAQEVISNTTANLNVPTIDLPAFLMSYGSGNTFEVDWIRIRQYCGADADVVVQAGEPTLVTMTSFSARPRTAAAMVWRLVAWLQSLWTMRGSPLP